MTQRREVWSDPQIQKLAQNFVPCTEEVDILFPRNEWLINNLRDDPAKILFTDVFGAQAPREHWNPSKTKTKQGVYCMMPDGTYLGARFAGTRTDDIREMLEQATEKWRVLVADRNLKPRKIPNTEAFSDWRSDESSDGLLLKTSYRDLPRDAKKDGRGRIVGESWNQGWLKFSSVEAKRLLPASDEWQNVDPEISQRLAREAMKDIVYGQSPEWKKEDVISAKLQMRRLSTQGNTTIIGYQGEFIMKDANHSFAPKLLGKAIWDGKKFTEFQCVAIGARKGGTTYNFREKDMDRQVMGVSLVLED